MSPEKKSDETPGSPEKMSDNKKFFLRAGIAAGVLLLVSSVNDCREKYERETLVGMTRDKAEEVARKSVPNPDGGDQHCEPGEITPRNPFALPLYDRDISYHCEQASIECRPGPILKPEYQCKKLKTLPEILHGSPFGRHSARPGTSSSASPSPIPSRDPYLDRAEEIRRFFEIK